MERPIGGLSLQSGVVTVHTMPYEIKTVKVRFALPTMTELVHAAK
jgi:hypothetical protein